MERRDEADVSTEDLAYGQRAEGGEAHRDAQGGAPAQQPAEGQRAEQSAEPHRTAEQPPRDGEPGAGTITPDPSAGSSEASAPLLSNEDSSGFERRWEEIQVIFVDEPRRSVEQADGLVAEVMKHLAEGFANERKGLEGQWDRGDEVSTEDLRVALQRYRSFFNRLLSTRGG